MESPSVNSLLKRLRKRCFTSSLIALLARVAITSVDWSKALAVWRKISTKSASNISRSKRSLL